MFDSLRLPALARFILLYAAMYAAFGVASPFLPSFVTGRGLQPEQLGLVLGAGTAVRLLTASLAGRIGDLIQGLRVVLVVCTALAAAVTLGYLPAHGFWPLLALSLWQAAALGPVTILADALRAPAGGVRMLLQRPRFRTLVLVAALILGSHAMHDAFAVIRWSAASVSPATVSVLWSESVAAEVLVFFIIGPALVTWLTPAGALAVAALAGMLRWTVMAQSAAVLALALVQPLHGITFALLHLACMRVLARTVPQGLEGTAQAIYGTVGIGAATASLTLISGALYARVGAQGFWGMAALCALAFPLTWKLRLPAFSERQPP